MAVFEREDLGQSMPVRLMAPGAVVLGVLCIACVAAAGGAARAPWGLAASIAAGLAGVMLVAAGIVLRRTTRALREHERHVRRIESACAIGDVAAMVAHDLRNRVQLLVGHASVGVCADPDEKDRRFARILAGVEDMRAVLDRLQDLARPRDRAPECVDLAAVCTSFADSVRHVLPAGIELHVDVPEMPVPVMVDVLGFEHALLNLVLNARDAMQGHGELRLAVARRAGRVEITVADTGPGVAAGDLERVFEPYYTTKPSGQGTGLGLAAVRGFVRSQGGGVELRSGSERGATFVMTLLLAPSLRARPLPSGRATG